MSQIQLRMTDALDQNRESKIGFHLSTFDIPRGATAELDKDAGFVTFRFRYVDEEPAGATQSLTDDISIDCGKHSGKLLALRINCKRYRTGQMRVSFHHAINDVDEALGKTIRQFKLQHHKKNFEIAKSVIDSNREEVAAAIAQ
jgi:hypothetical protein